MPHLESFIRPWTPPRPLRRGGAPGSFRSRLPPRRSLWSRRAPLAPARRPLGGSARARRGAGRRGAGRGGGGAWLPVLCEPGGGARAQVERAAREVLGGKKRRRGRGDGSLDRRETRAGSRRPERRPGSGRGLSAASRSADLRPRFIGAPWCQAPRGGRRICRVCGLSPLVLEPGSPQSDVRTGR